MSRADELRALLARVEETQEPDRLIDRDLFFALECKRIPRDGLTIPGTSLTVVPGVHKWAYHRDGVPTDGTLSPAYTSLLGVAKKLVPENLPGFWHSTTTCWRTADADVAPDFTGPHGDDLLAAGWSLEEHDAVTFSAVVAPGGPIHAECLALIAATLKALIAREGLTPPSPQVLAERRAALAAMKAAPPALSALITQEVEHGAV